MRTSGRFGQSETRAIGAFDHAPVDLRTSSMISGAVEVVNDVFTPAKTRPLPSVWSDFRFMWSSADWGPWSALSLAPHDVSGSPSWWTAKNIASVVDDWLLHMSPILLPPNAM